MYVPASAVIHEQNAAVGAYSDEFYRNMFTNRIRFMLKHTAPLRLLFDFPAREREYYLTLDKRLRGILFRAYLRNIAAFPSILLSRLMMR